MQIPILNGIYTDSAPGFRTAYPRNLTPVPKQQGISNGYLKPSDGVVAYDDTGPGASRGGINWNGILYRVMGAKFVSIDRFGVITIIGDVGGSGHVSLDYSFDYLSIASDNNLYLYDGATLQQVTDPDLGDVIDQIWIDGYFMTTDCENLVVTELSNPFSVLPTKYGSSEVDPDPIKAILKISNEPYVLNRYTIEVFSNVGGTGFPYQRVDGAQVSRGTIGTHTCCVFNDLIAFIGGGRKKSPAVWLASGGSGTKISTDEIDKILSLYGEGVLVDVLVECRIDQSHEYLYIHLPDQTLVYDSSTSKAVGEHVWFYLSAGLIPEQYTAKDYVWCYDNWLAGHPTTGAIGYLTDTTADVWGDVVSWEFSTMIMYNEGTGVIFHELELVCLSGRSSLGVESTVWTQYSLDGETWSNEKGIRAGGRGERDRRLVWLNQGNMRHWRIQKFHGTSDAKLSIARLEARIEPLSNG